MAYPTEPSQDFLADHAERARQFRERKRQDPDWVAREHERSVERRQRERTKPSDAPMAYVPILPHWTEIAVLEDATRERHGTKPGSGFTDLSGAPCSLEDADRAHERGELLKANRRDGKRVVVVFMTPQAAKYRA